jgi:hypothetical protein
MGFAGTPKSKLAQQQRNLGDFVKDKVARETRCRLAPLEVT